MQKILISPHYSQKAEISRLNIVSSITDFLIEKEFLPLITANNQSYTIFDQKINNLVDSYIDLKPSGVILTGGASIDPSFHDFKEDFSCKSQIFRDIFELKLFSKTVELNIPILGLCRGMQLINVGFGGTLKYVPQKNQPKHALTKKGEKNSTDNILEDMDHGKLHPLDLIENSDLFLDLQKIFDTKNPSVNSVHSQVIKKIGKQLSIDAISDDKEIEIISNRKKKILGLQFHPELDLKDKDYRGLFELWLGWL